MLRITQVMYVLLFFNYDPCSSQKPPQTSDMVHMTNSLGAMEEALAKVIRRTEVCPVD